LSFVVRRRRRRRPYTREADVTNTLLLGLLLLLLLPFLPLAVVCFLCTPLGLLPVGRTEGTSGGFLLRLRRVLQGHDDHLQAGDDDLDHRQAGDDDLDEEDSDDHQEGEDDHQAVQDPRHHHYRRNLE
jgi:hypothetical protein